MKKRACQYVRCSTDKQFYSVADQLKEMNLYAKQNGYTIVTEPFVDDGVSGRETEKRTEFLRMINLIENGNPGFEYVLFYDMSRLGRFMDHREFNYYLHICRLNGVSAVFTAANYKDDNSPATIITQTIDQLTASDYSRNLSRSVTRGMKSRSEQGYFMSVAPYGYLRAEFDSRGTFVRVLHNGERKWDKSHHLILTPGDPKEIDVIKKIFEMRKNEAGELRIANFLNSQSIPSPRGVKWSSSRIHSILTNPVYIGTARWGRAKCGTVSRKENTWMDTNSSPHLHDKDKWILREDAYEPIVDKDTFEEVQQLMKKRAFVPKKGEGRPYGSQFLLSGILFCGICGGKCGGESGKKKVGNIWTSYVCGTENTIGKSVCSGSNFNRSPVDQFVLDQIRDVVNDNNFITKVEEQLRARLDKRIDVKRQENALLKEIDRCKAGIEGLLDALEDKNNEHRDLINDRLSKNRRDLEALETELKSCREKKKQIDNVDDAIKKVKEKFGNIVNFLSDTRRGDFEINEIKKKIVREFLYRAVVSPDRTFVTFYFYKMPIVDAISNHGIPSLTPRIAKFRMPRDGSSIKVNPDNYRVVKFILQPDTIAEAGRTWYRLQVYANKVGINYTTTFRWISKQKLDTRVFYGTKYVSDREAVTTSK